MITRIAAAVEKRVEIRFMPKKCRLQRARSDPSDLFIVFEFGKLAPSRL
jgi:hypothetical protein